MSTGVPAGTFHVWWYSGGSDGPAEGQSSRAASSVDPDDPLRGASQAHWCPTHRGIVQVFL